MVYEVPGDDRVLVSVAKAIRDLGSALADASVAIDRLVELSDEYMTAVWENIEAHADVAKGVDG